MNEVAIMGLTRTEMQPIWTGAEFDPRLMVPVDLSYDDEWCWGRPRYVPLSRANIATVPACPLALSARLVSLGAGGS